MGAASSIAVVVPRHADGGMVGGAETLLRQLALRCAEAGHRVRLLTTCAKSHFTWANERPAGERQVDGLRVRCFPVDGGRDLERFLRVQTAIGAGEAVSDADEESWLRHGVNSRALEEHLRASGAAYDRIVVGPYLFGMTAAVAAMAPERTLLVPCLHDEPFARVRRFARMFAAVRGCIFNTEPERRLAARLFPVTAAPDRVAAVVGFALEPFTADPHAFAQRHGLTAPYLVYCGRREPLKGTPLLIDYWAAYRRQSGCDLKLVLTGSGPVEAPSGLAAHLIDRGYVSEQEKREAMAGALAFCHPSVNESLSIVLLESWLAGTPGLVHARGEVLRYQCRAAQGGLWFRDYPEFHESVELLRERPALRARLAAQGRAFVLRDYAPAAVQARLLAALDG